MINSPVNSDHGSSQPAPDDEVDGFRFRTSSRLMDSLLHDARNPLNALSINLDVLQEKLRGEDGKVPPSQDKNLKAIREQLFRVDGILRQFADFMTPRQGLEPSVTLAEVIQKALEVLSHECRKSRINVRHVVDAELRVRSANAADVRSLVLGVLMRGIARVPAGGELTVTLKSEGSEAVLSVTDSGPSGEPLQNAATVFDELARRLGGSASLRGHEVAIRLPRV